MKKILLLVVLILSPCLCYAIQPETPYLGNNPVPCNMTVSSTTLTTIISSQTYAAAGNLGDWVIQNNGGYSIYITTFQVPSGSPVTTIGNAFQLLGGQSLNIGGRTRKGLFGRTTEGTTNSCRIDMFYVYQD